MKHGFLTCGHTLFTKQSYGRVKRGKGGIQWTQKNHHAHLKQNSIKSMI